jgi:hypothetical protein
MSRVKQLLKIIMRLIINSEISAGSKEIIGYKLEDY